MSTRDEQHTKSRLDDFVNDTASEAATRMYRLRRSEQSSLPEQDMAASNPPSPLPLTTQPIAGSQPPKAPASTEPSGSWRSWERDFNLSQILGAIDNPGTLCSRVSVAPGVNAAQQIWQTVNSLPLFQSVIETEARLKIARGEIRVDSVDRDQLLETADRLVLLLSGHLALGWFPAPVLAEELAFQNSLSPGVAKSATRIFDWRVERGPLSKRAVANLAYFDDRGVAISLSEVLGKAPEEPLGLGDHLVLALYCLTPAVVLSVPSECIESWRQSNKEFAGGLERALAPARQRLARTGAVPDSVTDFFIRHGLSIAKTLRVVDLDKCTGCRDCEDACAERYGVSRLRLDGPRLGPVALADCCRTCEDRRCIAVCGYDAIAYDAALGEVRIFDSHCIGCSKCSLACPYGAIEMHDLAGQPQLAARVTAQAARDAAVRPDLAPDREVTRRTRIASKCDHCQTSYNGQQACISACQKDALLELTPSALFRSRPAPPIPVPAQPATSRNSKEGLLPLSVLRFRKQELVASWPTPEPRVALRWPWLVSLASLALLAVEVHLRRTVPHSSLTAALVKIVNISPPRDWHGPHSSLGLLLGVLGTTFMALAALYTPFARIRSLRRDAGTRGPDAQAAAPSTAPRRKFPRLVGRIIGALPFHAWAGLIGPGFILLHTEGRLVGYSDFGVLALWFSLITVAAGVIMRHGTAGLQLLVTRAQVRLDATSHQAGIIGGAASEERARLARRADLLHRQVKVWTLALPLVRHLKHVHLPAAVLCGVLVLFHIITALKRL